MDPKETGAKYDKIAHWWQQQHLDSNYGLSQLRRTLGFSSDQKTALDVGCGAGGRFIRHLGAEGFDVTGLDVSANMIVLAKEQHPSHEFIHEDICSWQSDKHFDVIVAWDSLFHLPIEQHIPVLKKLCSLLNPSAVLMYTLGDDVGWHKDNWRDDEFYYSSIGVAENIKCLLAQGMALKHLELDQHPEKHVVIIAVKQDGKLQST